MIGLDYILEHQRNALDTYCNGSFRVEAKDTDVFLINLHITLCHLIKHLEESNMRGNYHRPLPADFETVSVGTKKAVEEALEHLEAALDAPVAMSQFVRDEIQDAINLLRKQ